VSAAGASRRRRMSERRRERLRTLTSLVARGLTLRWAALGIGVHASTASRWRRRAASGEPLSRRRGPRVRPLSVAVCNEAAHLVQEMHGLIGAETLRHSVPGLTRRAAADIKTDTCRVMERERRQGTERVTVAAPGILRGFDAMELGGRGRERSHALIAADGCVPYRTSWAISPRYDGKAVAEILNRDFDAYGAPLVLRLDRATSHDVPAVRELLETQRVLPLHGPSHYARYYGQLERQNREHRAWLAASDGPLDLDEMMAALNRRWRRSTLGWSTAQELWQRRPVIDVDRNALAEDVHERAAHLRRTLHAPPSPQDLSWRIAVKQALVGRGLLRIEKGGWC
jgi:hypothetical protein